MIRTCGRRSREPATEQLPIIHGELPECRQGRLVRGSGILHRAFRSPHNSSIPQAYKADFCPSDDHEFDAPTARPTRPKLLLMRSACRISVVKTANARREG